ncbi:MAG: Ldh family oxidoreductase [Pseudomonadota bacterium]
MSAATLPAPQLIETATAILSALGVSPEDAKVTAQVFVGADMAGEPSHGLRLFVTVCERLAAGGHRAATWIDVDRDFGAIAVWDAHHSIGQVVASRAMTAAMEKARTYGIGLVTVREATSLTSAKHYVLMAAEAGMIGIVHTNAIRKVMAPPGGMAPVMGNNPIAFAAPAGRHGHLCIDMAMTTAAIGRIYVARDRGEAIPLDWALGADGRPTSDAAEAAKVMSLLPFGGYKALALGLMNEVMTSVLASGEVFAGPSTGFHPPDAPMHTAFTMTALSVDAFADPAAFKDRMEHLVDTLKGSPAVDANAPVRAPGERSQALAAERAVSGIPLDAQTLGPFTELCARHGVPTPWSTLT